MLAAAFERSAQTRAPRFAIEAVPTAALGQRAPRPLRAGLISSRPEAAEWMATDFDATIQDVLKSLSGVSLP